MNLFDHYRTHVLAVIESLVTDGVLPEGIDLGRVAVEPPRETGHGDISTNAAMILAKPAAMKPRALADQLAARLADVDAVTDTEVAGPGFINITLADDFWRDRLREILTAGAGYGESQIGGGEKVNVEYVSTNPTGPLHVGLGQ